MKTIKLIKNMFYKENKTKKQLAKFIKSTKQLSMSEKCKQFEIEFSKWQGRRYSVLFNSGSSANLALLQALKNLGILKQKDKIAISAITWATNFMPIIQLGFIPVPVDVGIDTLNITLKAFFETINSQNIKCLFITNCLGFTSNLCEIKKLCEKNNIILLEDNAESMGTERHNLYPLFNPTTGNEFNLTNKTGNFGSASTFSTFCGHHFSTIEGGLVCTDDKPLYDMLVMVRAHGWDRNLDNKTANSLIEHFGIDNFLRKYTFYDLAFNLRPTEITGFLGLIQLKYIDLIIDKREKQFKEFNEACKKNNDFILLDTSGYYKLSVFGLPIICKTTELRNKYLKIFDENKIETRPVIAGNICNQPVWKKYVKTRYSLPNADFIEQCGLYITNDPQMSKKEFKRILNCIK